MTAPAPAPDQVFLTDFGLAKNVRTGSRYTRTGETLGTPHYMSPEQARGELTALTAASDSWALGCILHELVTGRPAFDGETTAAVIAQVIAGRPPDIAAGRPDLPRGLRRVWAACLARAPKARPRTAAEVAADCGRLLRGERPRSRPPRRWGWVPVAAAVVLAAGAVGMWATSPGRTPSAERAPTDAELRAAKAWTLRSSDVRAGAAMLAELLAREPERHEWRLRHGLLLWSAGDGDAAQTQWARIPDAAPAGSHARLYAALVPYFTWDGEAFRTEAAVPALQALQQRPDRIGRLARAALRLADDADAAGLAELEGVTGWEAAYLRALALQEMQPVDRERQLAAYRDGLETGVRFAWALNNRGLVHRDLDHVHAAIDDFTAALALEPRYRAALINRGSLYEATRQPEKALADYRAAVRLDERDPVARFNMGCVLQALDRRDEAIDAYGAALDRDPRFLPALVNRAGVYRSRGAVRAGQGDQAGARADWEAAIAHFGRAIEVTPSDVTARLNRGRLLFATGDRRAALADLDEAVALAPAHASARNNRGLMRATMGDAAGAMADFDAALAADPDHADARYNRGKLHFALGDVARARADFDAVLDREPEHVRALIGRGRLLLQAGNLPGALVDFDLAVGVAPEFADAYLKRSVVYTQQGKLELARADLDRCLAIDQRIEDAWFNRGIVRKLQGDLAGAIDDWRHVLTIASPRWPRRAKAQAFIRDLERRLAEGRR